MSSFKNACQKSKIFIDTLKLKISEWILSFSAFYFSISVCCFVISLKFIIVTFVKLHFFRFLYFIITWVTHYCRKYIFRFCWNYFFGKSVDTFAKHWLWWNKWSTAVCKSISHWNRPVEILIKKNKIKITFALTLKIELCLISAKEILWFGSGTKIFPKSSRIGCVINLL